MYFLFILFSFSFWLGWSQTALNISKEKHFRNRKNLCFGLLVILGQPVLDRDRSCGLESPGLNVEISKINLSYLSDYFRLALLRKLSLRPRPQTPREFEKRRFHSASTSNVFRSHYAGIIQERNNHRLFGLTSFPGSLETLGTRLMCPHYNRHEKPAFSNSSGLKSVFVELRFRDGLVWTVGLTVKIKLHFHISPVLCWRYLNLVFFFPRRK